LAPPTVSAFLAETESGVFHKVFLAIRAMPV